MLKSPLVPVAAQEGRWLYWTLALASFITPRTQAQCTFTQNVQPGVYYDIANPNYPRPYTGGSTCSWDAYAAEGNTLQLSCGIFNIPSSPNCVTDRLSVSPTGNPTLTDAHVYCGQGSFTVQSYSNRLLMVLQSVSYSQGGYFYCNITAISSNCICGIRKQTRIVGGTETGINEFPMMAGLIDVSLGDVVFCGATIISRRYAVTAAHCLLNRNITKLGLLVGEHDLDSGTETSATKLYRLSQIIPHTAYNSNTQDNDIGLVRVVNNIAFSAEVMPACLPFRFKDYSFAGNKVEVLGWGTTEFGGAPSRKLMKANLIVQTPAQCTAVYGNTVSYRQMCTYSNGVDACQMDSGGPLLFEEPYITRLYLVGIVSHGIGCATSNPGVSTRVTSYLDWITTIVSAEDQLCHV